MKKKSGFILSILAILCLIVITGGVSYAFFTYAKEGTTDNIIRTGTITFLYTEVEANGAGISIEDALPINDETGKAQMGAQKVFNFKIQSINAGKTSIPYEVTARKKNNSTLDEEAIKLYLTEVMGDQETEVLLDTYDNLKQTSIAVAEDIIEKKIYTDTVPANSSNYEKNFRLRMWIPDTIDFSGGKYNGKTFTITINVYANTEVITVPSQPTP